MTSKDIKLLAGNIVLESEYSDSAKKQLLNFIANEATDHQIKTLILDGNIETIAEDAKAIVDKRFDNISDKVIIEGIEDTAIFLGIGRETICKYLNTQNQDKNQLKEMKNFVLNEASDYQIMSVLIDDILPDETSNPIAETVLFEGLNMIAGTSFVPLSEYDMSSINILSEAYAGSDSPKYGLTDDRINQIKKSLAHLKGPKAGPHIERLKGELAKLQKQRFVTHAKGYATGAVQGAELTAKQAKEKVGDAIIKGKHIAKKLVGKAQKYGGQAVAKGKEVAGAAKEKISGALKDLPSASAIGGKISAAATSPAGMAVGGLAAAALVGYGAYKIYKNYFSAAAKKCAGSPDKSACMKAARSGAVKAQIADLSKGVGACSKAKDPAKCKAAVQNKIAKLRSKMA